LAKAPEVYTLASSTVYRRLRKIIETPELASFIGNPQIARLVYNQNKVNSRLKYLQSKNCVSLNLLVTSNSLFNRFLKLFVINLRTIVLNKMIIHYCVYEFVLLCLTDLIAMATKKGKPTI